MRYRALPKDTELGVEECFLQAAAALDAAGVEASRVGDVGSLTNVSAMWMKLGENIVEVSKLTHGTEKNSDIVVGFHGRGDNG